MKAVILPAGTTETLKPLTSRMPEYLLPVVNKPVVEHLIELLYQHNIKDIILLLKHMPYETEKYFGDGSKWGCTITYSLIRDYHDPISSIRKIRSKINEPCLCLPWNIITNLDISAFVESHEQSHADISIAETSKRDFLVDKRDFYPFIITPDALSLLDEARPHQNLEHVIKTSFNNGISYNKISEEYDLKIIHNLNEYFQINQYVLCGGIDGIHIPGKEIQSGVHVGRGTRIHDDAIILPPALIGDNAHIKRDVFIGKNSIIGNNVILDVDASVRESIVLENTYIGPHNDVHQSIVRKNSLTSLPHLLDLFMQNDLILGDLNKKAAVCGLECFFNRAMALFLFILFSPVTTLLFLYHLLKPGSNYLISEERNGGFEVAVSQGTIRPKNFRFYYFRSRIPVLRKLPGLINVIKGDIRLVGNSVLTQDEASTIKEEWEFMRFNAPSGLFHPWETVHCNNPAWEEKIASENVYAATRSFKGDVKILLKTLTLIRSPA
jgi:NDP-sugar pyrophosphorylase family protein